MRNFGTKVCFAILAVLILTFAFACTPKATPTPTPTPTPEVNKPDVIRILIVGEVTGPYAPITGYLNIGAEDAVDYFNAHDSIDGVPLEVVTADAAGKVDVGISQYIAYMSQKPKPTFVFVMTSGMGEAIHDRVIEDDVLAIVPAASTAIYPKGNSFGNFCAYPDQVGGFFDWLKADWKESRPPKVAFLTWDSVFGKAILVDPVYEYAEKLGIEIVDTQVFAMSTVDLTTQLLDLKEKQPDYIYTNSVATGPVGILRGLNELGWDNVTLAGGVSMNNSVLNLIEPELAEGMIGVLPVLSFDETDNPGIKYVSDLYNGRGVEARMWRSESTSLPWGWIPLCADVVQRAVDDVGWDGLNNDVLKEKMVTANVDAWDGMMEMNFTPDRYTPTKGILHRVQGGKVVPITDWVELPDLVPPSLK